MMRQPLFNFVGQDLLSLVDTTISFGPRSIVSIKEVPASRPTARLLSIVARKPLGSTMTARTSKSGPSSVVSDDASGDLHKSQSYANSPRAKRVSRRSANKPKPPPVRAFVEHHYHDHARDPVAESVEVVGHRGDGVMSRSFPEKLHQLLEAMHEEGLEHIVSWQPHGRCFAIHQKTEFVNDIMPRFFMQTKLTSFQRQLNLYGTSRLLISSVSFR